MVLTEKLRISWNAKEPNKTMPVEASTARSPINRIRQRQATMFGHVMRIDKLEHHVATGIIEEKNCRGIHREKMLN